MDETNQSSKEGTESNERQDLNLGVEKLMKPKKKKWTSKVEEIAENEEVLLKVGKLEYRAPSKRQRLVLGAVVLGLNLLLVLSVVAYFYIPSFQEFIYNVGR